MDFITAVKRSVGTVIHKKYQPLFPGNRVYYVDRLGRPHNGIVIAVNGQTIGVGYLTNYTGPTSEYLVDNNVKGGTGIQDWVESGRLTKTAEIYCGEKGEIFSEYFGKDARSLSYKHMPKKPIDPGKVQRGKVYTDRYVKIRPGCFIQDKLTKEMYELLEDTRIDRITKFILVDKYNRVAYPAFPIWDDNTFIQCVNPNSIFGMKLLDENKRIIEIKDIKVAYEPDFGYDSKKTWMNPDHLTPIYKG